MKIFFSIFFICLFSWSLAQGDFAELSAKERIDIAEKEEKESKSDAVFQDLMREGHQYFEKKHYLKAIHKYEEASDRRPFNVFPKVIIADIELSMKDTLAVLRKAEQEMMEREKPAPEKPKEIRETPQPENETPEERIDKIDEWEAMERERLQRERERQEQKKEEPKVVATSGDVEQLSLTDFQEDLARQFPEGITEETTTEGNKTIVKRIVVSGGKGDEYKKVVHNWGGVFYFKNGEAVTERVWKQETER